MRNIPSSKLRRVEIAVEGFDGRISVLPTLQMDSPLLGGGQQVSSPRAMAKLESLLADADDPAFWAWSNVHIDRPSTPSSRRCETAASRQG
jgi:hypothetical protein